MERFAGRYALLRPLGRGGMGEVFLARDLTTGSLCALKRLTQRTHPEARAELAREFDLIARVRHPAVVAVHELGFTRDGVPFYTMEYVAGRPAHEAVRSGDWPTLCFVAARVAHGIEALHRAGVVHGDLKPSNLLVVSGAEPGALPLEVRLLDFGLAGLLAGERRGHRGTPGYAAPEVVRGDPAGEAADLYGLGATLYALIAGRPPFAGETATARLRHQQAGPPPGLPLEEAGAPAALVRLVLRLMAPAPGERPRDARAVRRELETFEPAARWPLAERVNVAMPVGRERELARLEVARGTGRDGLVLVTGDAGFGKSLLLETAALRATLAGAWVARLSCAALDGPGAVARALLLRLAADAAEGDGEHAELRAALERGDPAALDDADALVAAGVAWAGAIGAQGRDRVVLLDDAERMDAASGAVIRRLALHDPQPIRLWVWARRDPVGGPVEDDRALLEAGRAERLPLRALSREAVANLAAARLQSPAPTALVEFLWERGGGHPGLTVELLRAAAAAGALVESESGPAIRPDALAAVAAPESFEASLLGRLAALPDEAQAVAMRLAAFGRAVEPASLDAPPAALDALIAAGLVAREAGRGVRLVPPALARPLLDSLEVGARRALHRSLLENPALGPAERFRHRVGAGDPAGALEEAERAIGGTRDAHLAAEVAYVAETVETVRAAPWHERAAALEMDRGRYDAAIPHLERALALDPDPRARGMRWVWLARATFRAGRPADVERAVRAALEEGAEPAVQSEVLTTETMRLRAMGEADAALECARRAVELAERCDDPRVRGLAAMTLGATLIGRREFDEADRVTTEAVEWFRKAGDRVGVIRSTVARGVLARARLMTRESEQLLRSAGEAARQEGARLALDEALSNLSVLLMESGRWKEARSADAESLRLALEDARPRNAVLGLANLAIHDALGGVSDSARRYARAALRLARRYWPEREALAWRALASAHRVSGHLGAAAASATRAMRLSDEAGELAEQEWSRIELARARIRQGRMAQAHTLIELALGRSGSSVARAVMAVLCGRAALRTHDVNAAESRLAEVEGWLAEHPAPWVAAFAAQLRAEIAIHAGRDVEASASAGQALEAFGALPAPPDHAEAALGFARLAMEHGGRSLPVGEWLELAAQGFERLGDHRGREQALGLLVSWQRRGSSRGQIEGRERNLIGAVSRLIQSLPDLHELARRAMQLAVEQLGAERGVLLLADETSGRLAPFIEHGAVDPGTRREAVGYSRQVVERVATSRGPLIIGDAPTDPGSLSDSMVNMRLRSIVCVPLFLGGRVIGAVYMDDARRPDVFSDDDRALLQAFAELMAVAIENSRGHEEVRRENEALVGENLSLRQQVGARYQPHNVLGVSEPMQRVLSQIQQVARFDTTVLITGENGTGKDLLARVVHHTSRRRLHPFVTVDCAALTETLIESTLYGHKRGAFTGADRDRPGQFQLADRGTLFLNEIGEMPLHHQVKLLHALGSREITPQGGSKPVPVDVRVIAATNRDLTRMVEEGRFRIDLYHRLNVVQIEVPPLRDRKADIPELAEHFTARFAKQHGRPTPELSEEFIAALLQSDWPGNVRELENYIERVMALSPGDVLRPEPPPPGLTRRRGALSIQGRKLSEVIAKLERRMVRDALDRSRGNQSVAARELGLTEQSMRYRLRKYGLDARRNRRMRRFQR